MTTPCTCPTDEWNPRCPTHGIAQHFPWYTDPTDTTNIDCQCGHPIGNGIQGWADHINNTLTQDPQQPTPTNQPWTYCGDPHCQDCTLGTIQ